MNYNDSYKENFRVSFDSLLDALKQMMNERPERAENSLLIEMVRHNMCILYNIYTDKSNGSKVSKEDKDKWRETLKTINNQINTLQNVPKCILEFEIDILRKGLELLPLGEQIGINFLVNGIKGAV